MKNILLNGAMSAAILTMGGAAWADTVDTQMMIRWRFRSERYPCCDEHTPARLSQTSGLDRIRRSSEHADGVPQTQNRR